jgi:[protein-PII] uridylyltransferase
MAPRGAGPTFDRAGLLAAPDLRGRAWVDAYTRAADGWLGGLFNRAVAMVGDGSSDRLALVAVGGYGRAELAPGSDLDLLLVHDGRRDVAQVAEALWYPIWDTGLKLGHAVRTPREAHSLAADDLDTATSLLDVRHLAGDAKLAARVAEGALEAWQKRGRRWLERLADSVDDRHAAAGEVAYLLEPDLKLGRGGLRDVHALHWASQAHQVLLPGDGPELSAAYDVLLSARVELHRRTGRTSDILALQEQDSVADALGDTDADDFMRRLATAARMIAWTSDETWYRVRSVLSGPGWSRKPRTLAPGVLTRDREVLLSSEADPARDPAVALRVAAEAARRRIRIDRTTLDRLAGETPVFPDPWPDGALDALVDLLLAGHDAIEVVESLDRKRIWERVLPEWVEVQSKPQRNAYHRFTVDRHLMEAAANAAALAVQVRRPDLLVLGSLLHDIGKGRAGDHTEIGMGMVRQIGTRVGLPDADVEILVDLVRYHLLLPDVATRRDLTDEATITGVADAVGSTVTLELLAALTEADSLATGPSAWGAWKAGLVADLVERTGHVLRGGAVQELAGNEFPTSAQRQLLARGVLHVEGNGDTLVVVAPDRPGLLSRIAGAVALHGLDVLAADAVSDNGSALDRLRVEHSLGMEIDWTRVTDNVRLAAQGRLAVEARLAARARSNAHRYRPIHLQPTVTFDDDASATATVIEVHAADRVGLLHRITRAFADLDLDIRTAKVQTLGTAVVDSFYVTDPQGRCITDEAHRAEITRAVLHAVT